MKRIGIILILIISLSNCNWKGDYSFDVIPDFGITTTKDAMLWTAHFVRYVSDTIHDRNEYWQSPDQTYVWRTGDCEDYAILAMFLVYRDVGAKPRLVMGWYNNDSHGWVEVNGEWWESQTGQLVTGDKNYRVKRYISYNETMYRATHGHRAIIEENTK